MKLGTVIWRSDRDGLVQYLGSDVDLFGAPFWGPLAPSTRDFPVSAAAQAAAILAAFGPSTEFSYGFATFVIIQPRAHV